MNLMLFLGSGISLSSGLPGTEEITNRLLHGDWYAYSNSAFYPGHDLPYRNEPAARCQEFLKILKDEVDRYYWLTDRIGECNYEDLYYLARQIADEELHEIDNPAVYDFAARIRKDSWRLCKLLQSSEDNLTLKELAEKSCDFISWCVRHLLKDSGQNLIGFDLISKIAQSEQFQRIDIFTLNHDCLIEIFFSRYNDITFTDGFDDKPDGDIRFYNPALYDQERKIRLFKLHGSVHWFRSRAQIGRMAVDRFAIPLDDIWSGRDNSGNEWRKIEPCPILLTGTYNKIMDYTVEIFADMYYRFHKALHQNNIMIMSGYGWNDHGISKRLIEWLQSSTNRRLYLCHERPEDIRDKSKSGMWHRYDEFEKDGRLIPIPKWPRDMSAQEIDSLIGKICYQSDNDDDMGHQTIAYTGVNQ